MTDSISFAPNREAQDMADAAVVAAERKESGRQSLVRAIGRTRGQIVAARALLAEAGLEVNGESVVGLVQALAMNEANAMNDPV